MEDKNEDTNKEILKIFIEYHKAQQKLSHNTLKSYIIDITQYLNYLEANNINLKNVSRFHIRSFLIEFQGKIKSTTLARKIAAIRTFHRFLELHGYVVSNPTFYMKSPPIKRKLPYFLNYLEMKKLMNAPDINSILGKRDRAILEILFSCGIRVSELTNLKIEDIDFVNEMIKVKGKRKKERILPITKRALKYIMDYINERKNFNNSYVFLNKLGGKISERSIQRMIKKYCLKAGLPLSITPHTLRHSYATFLINSGANLRVVQELLGHSSLATTQIYTHINTSKLIETYKDTHPRA